MKKLICLLITFTVITMAVIITYSLKTNNAGLEKFVFAMEQTKKANEKQQYDLVIAGDSRVIHALRPKYLKDKFQIKRAYNYAFATNSYSDFYLNFLDERISPQGTILLGITPQSLTLLGENMSLRRMRQDRTWWQWQIHYFKLLLKNITPHWNLVSVATNPNALWQWPQALISKTSEDGWIGSECPEPDEMKVMGSYLDGYSRFKFNDQLFSNLRRKVNEWRRKDIKVYFFFPPRFLKIESLEHDLKITGFDPHKVRQQLERSGAKFLNITHRYPTCDGDHLDQNQAQRFSMDLAQLMGSENS